MRVRSRRGPPPGGGACETSGGIGTRTSGPYASKVEKSTKTPGYGEWRGWPAFFLEKVFRSLIIGAGCARRGASGALNPKSAYAGLNSLPRIGLPKSWQAPAGRRATGGREPRQVRKEAAISDAACVADRSRPFAQTAIEGRIRWRVHNLLPSHGLPSNPAARPISPGAHPRANRRFPGPRFILTCPYTVLFFWQSFAR